jgi:hypothetical protein
VLVYGDSLGVLEREAGPYKCYQSRLTVSQACVVAVV